MSLDILKMREKTIKKNLELIETQLNKGEIGDYNKLKEVIDIVNHKITETEKEIKSINIELTTNNIKNNNLSTKESSQKLEKLKKQFRKLEKKLNNNSDNNKDIMDQDDERVKSIPYNSFKKLQLATRSTIEMENLTGNILGNLNNQTTQMKGVTSKIGMMNNDIDSSTGVIMKMIGRGNRDKKIIILFGLLLFVIIVGVFLSIFVSLFRYTINTTQSVI